MSGATGLRRLAVASAFALALVALVTLRSARRGAEEMAASDRALELGQPELSLRHAERAAVAYVPGAEHVEAAYARLRALALGAERQGDQRSAQRAWQALRSAALQSRHLLQPRPEELLLAEEHLARLGAAEPKGALVSANGAELPGPLGALALAFGFALAGGSLAWLVWSGLAPSGEWRWRAACAPALAVCTGVLVLGWALLRG